MGKRILNAKEAQQRAKNATLVNRAPLEEIMEAIRETASWGGYATRFYSLDHHQIEALRKLGYKVSSEKYLDRDVMFEVSWEEE